MKWFKHHTDLSRNPEFAGFLAEAGLDGWGFLHRVYEIVGEQLMSGKKPEVAYPIRAWCTMLGVHRNRFNKLLNLAHTHGVLRANFDDTGGVCRGFEQGSPTDTLTLSCRKLLEWHDEYFRKSGQTPDNVQVEEEVEEEADQKADPPSYSPRRKRQPKRGGAPQAITQILGIGNSSIQGVIDRIMSVSDEPHWRDWWEQVIDRLVEGDSLSDMEGWIRYAEDCADPQKRALKDLGPLEKPGAFLVGKALDICRRKGFVWPSFPEDVQARSN